MATKKLVTFGLELESGNLHEKTVEVLDGSHDDAIADHAPSMALWMASQVLPHDGFGSWYVKDETGKTISGPHMTLKFDVAAGQRRAD